MVQALYQLMSRRAPFAVAAVLFVACASTQPYTQERSVEERFSDSVVKVTGAEQKLLDRIANDPGDFDAYYNLGVVYEDGGKVERAENAYRKALLLEPRHIAASVNLASLYRQRGEYRKAITVLSDLFDTGMDDPRARTDLAVLYRVVGDYDRSLYESSQVLKRFGLVYGAMLNSGLVYLDLGKVEMALTLFLELQNQFPDDSQLHFSIGRAYAALDNPYAAEQEYNKAVSLDADAYEAHNNLGVLRMLKQEWSRAVTAFERAVSANVNFATAHLNLGIAHRNLEQYEPAERAYRRAISIRPNYRTAWFNLALLYDEYWDRPDNALESWNTYLERFSEDLDESQVAEVEKRIAALQERREKLRAQQATEPEPEPEPEPAPQETSAPAPASEPAAAQPATEPAATDSPATEPVAGAQPPADAPTEVETPLAAEEPAAESVAAPDFPGIVEAYNNGRQDAGMSPVEPTKLIEQLAQKAQQIEASKGVRVTFDVKMTQDGKPKLVPRKLE